MGPKTNASGNSGQFLVFLLKNGYISPVWRRRLGVCAKTVRVFSISRKYRTAFPLVNYVCKYCFFRQRFVFGQEPGLVCLREHLLNVSCWVYHSCIESAWYLVGRGGGGC